VSGSQVIKLPYALRDLDEAAAYIQRVSTPKRAIRFLRAANSSFARLAKMPGLGTRYEPHSPVYAGLRYFPITRHRNHVIFYRPVTGGIEVLRVLHGAQDIHRILSEEFGVEDDGGHNQAEGNIE
jgi:toxin ParE1/3/4